MKKYNVCIAGATGAVGKALIDVLQKRRFPIENLYLLASKKSAGTFITFNGSQVEVLALENFDFSRAQIGLFSAGALLSEIYAPKAATVGCVVVDNTSHFRMDKDIPLVVPEVNPHRIADCKKKGIIANPNCSTIQMVVALKPIVDAVGISRINVATYQAVSGSGKQAIDELDQQSQQLLDGKPTKAEVYPYQIANNCLPHIDVFQDNGYTKEEMKMVLETQKIFEDDTILVNPTAVRIPVHFGHSEAVHIETKEPISIEKVKELLTKAEGVIVMDDIENTIYPTSIDASGQDEVFVGRIRKDISHPNGINLWVVADNVRKGAATNTVQIAELYAEKFL